MATTIGYIRMPGRGRRSPNGMYVECRTGFMGLRRCQGCQRCHGDGWVKVGTKKGNRRGRKPKGAVRRGAWRLGIGGAIVAFGNARFGTIGAILATVLVVAWLALMLLAWLSAPSGGRKKRRRGRRGRSRRR